MATRVTASWRVRHGWTRLEVLLVSSVALFNVTIVLQIVQMQRETARKEQCKHNIKQVGLALSNYHDVYKIYPAGFDVSPEGNYLGWGWNLKILPFLNAADVYHAVEPHFAKGIPGLPDAPEFKRRLPSLWCLSDTKTEMIPHAKVVTAKVVEGIVSEGIQDWQNRFPHSSYFSNDGGAHFVFADGHVRFISQQVNLLTFRSLSLINDFGFDGKVPH